MVNEYERFAKLLVLEMEAINFKSHFLMCAVKNIVPLMENTNISDSVKALLEDLYCMTEKSALEKFSHKCNVTFFNIFPDLIEGILEERFSFSDGMKVLNLLVNEKFMFNHRV